MPSLIIVDPTIPPPPPPPPPPPKTQAQGFQITWTGPDGVTWDLTNALVRLKSGDSGIQGLGAAPPTHYRDVSPAIPGAIWRGLNTGPGQVVIQLWVPTSDGVPWVEADAAAYASFGDPTGLGVLRIARPDTGTWRQIGCRYESGFEGNYVTDPNVLGYALYTLTYTTEDPFWRGVPIVGYFPYSPPLPFYATWPPMINSAQTLGSATVTNPGGVETAPVARADGPFTGFEVGVGDATVAMTLTKAKGQWVEVDARAGKLTMLDETGARVWKYATKDNLIGMSVPPGEDVKLTARIDGPASGSAITVTFEPGYRRAW